MINCVQGQDRTSGRMVCNEQSCPTMSAGPTTYTWIDTNRNPINLPAPTYIKHIQTWVNGKIQDASLFPTDTFTSAPPLSNPSNIQHDPNYWQGKANGFPQRFEGEIKNMYVTVAPFLMLSAFTDSALHSTGTSRCSAATRTSTGRTGCSSGTPPPTAT
jgi:hypothetical protein